MSWDAAARRRFTAATLEALEDAGCRAPSRLVPGSIRVEVDDAGAVISWAERRGDKAHRFKCSRVPVAEVGRILLTAAPVVRGVS